MRILFVGAGAWGTALAANASAHGQQVTLWLRDGAQARALRDQGENARYLPGVPLPPGVRIACAAQTPLAELARAADLTIIATPMRALRESLAALRGVRPALAWLCKGFEEGGGLGHEICARELPGLPGAVLSGPSFALEVARQQPTALVAASRDAPLRQTLVAAFHNPSLRIYTSDDVVGVEVGGAVKNLLAIAAGLCDGLALGMNARAALLTRGLAEMTRLGVALGARSETFMGLSGMGDLLLTATGELSRNRRVGLALARGQSLAHILADLGHVAEGVYSARTVLARARSLQVDMPIAETVVRLLDGQFAPSGPDDTGGLRQAAQQLMARQPRGEQGAAAAAP